MSGTGTEALRIQNDLLRALAEGQQQILQDVQAIAGAQHTMTLIIAAVVAGLPEVERERFIQRLRRPISEIFPNWTPSAQASVEAQTVLAEIAVFLEQVVKLA